MPIKAAVMILLPTFLQPTTWSIDVMTGAPYSITSTQVLRRTISIGWYVPTIIIFLLDHLNSLEVGGLI